ncbi:hypothetical protein [Pseudohalioglobus lutimaris]|uniref:hypothetical protein n=1 Tax=Pseudohalioglobus lutimaris TaxID=1737061 RepID=UPI0010548ECE|nr:hypothetical protein [Pseudohalioglobus lutimaris]
MEELCKEHAEDAVEFLSGLLGDDTAPMKERVEAARQLLDRGFGQPVSRVLMASVGEGNQSPSEMSLDQLMQKAGALLEHQGDIVDEQ